MVKGVWVGPICLAQPVKGSNTREVIVSQFPFPQSHFGPSRSELISRIAFKHVVQMGKRGLEESMKHLDPIRQGKLADIMLLSDDEEAGTSWCDLPRSTDTAGTLANHGVLPSTTAIIASPTTTVRPAAASRPPSSTSGNLPPLVMAPKTPSSDAETTPRDHDVSTAHVEQEDDNWEEFRIVNPRRSQKWPQWSNGIWDLRKYRQDGKVLREGLAFQWCMQSLEWVIRSGLPCLYKVGITSNVRNRWIMYNSDPTKYTPTHMFLLLRVKGRVAAAFVEAGLIQLLLYLPHPGNQNEENGDKGGEGPRHADKEHIDWHIYVAVRSALF
jgi:hypothetical protein